MKINRETQPQGSIYRFWLLFRKIFQIKILKTKQMIKVKTKQPHCSPGALLPPLAIWIYSTWFLLQMICDVPSMLYYEADK